MTRVIKNVALVGASGYAGSVIFKSLIRGDFNITVLVREEGKSFGEGVAVKKVDFASVESLTAAMKGNDAVVDAGGSPDPSLAIRLMNAAVAAKVYRYVPGEFSNDPRNTAVRSLPVFQGKQVALDYLEKITAKGEITFTSVSNGAFLNWGLANGFLGIDLPGKTIQLMNDGNHVFQWTEISSVGKAVTAALLNPEETKNKVCCIYSFQKSQAEVAELAKDALGRDGWTTTHVDMNAKYEAALAAVASGDFSFGVMGDFIKYSISTPGYAARLESDDNKLLQVEPMTDDQIKQVILGIAQETGNN